MLDLHQNWECDGRSAGSVDVIPLCSYGVVIFFFDWAELLETENMLIVNLIIVHSVY